MNNKNDLLYTSQKEIFSFDNLIVSKIKYNKKPTSWEIGIIQNQLKKNQIYLCKSIEYLKNYIEKGHTLRFNVNNTTNWIIIDVDKSNTKYEKILDCLTKYNLMPLLAYRSFSWNGDANHNFRLIYHSKNHVSKENYYKFCNFLAKTLRQDLSNGEFFSIDEVFLNTPHQLCFGTNKNVYLNHDYTQKYIDQIFERASVFTSQIKNVFAFPTFKKASEPNSLINFSENYINDLENLKYLDFIKTLKNKIDSNEHLGFHLGLHLYFANFGNEKYQNKILELVSKDTKKSILRIESKNNNYGYKIFKPQGNFAKLYYKNLKKIKITNQKSNIPSSLQKLDELSYEKFKSNILHILNENKEIELELGTLLFFAFTEKELIQKRVLELLSSENKKLVLDMHSRDHNYADILFNTSETNFAKLYKRNLTKKIINIKMFCK